MPVFMYIVKVRIKMQELRIKIKTIEKFLTISPLVALGIGSGYRPFDRLRAGSCG